MFSKRTLILVLLVLCACQPAVVEPTSVRQTIRAAYSPTLGWVGALMNNCSRLYAVDVLITEVPTGELVNSDTDLVFSWGSNPFGDEPVYQMGSEDLAVVINPQNALDQINLAQLSGIYNQSIQTWAEVDEALESTDPIVRWSFPDEQDTRLVMESILTIRDSGFSPLWLAPDAHAMRQAVASDPLAIGYLPRHWLDASVKEVAVVDENQGILKIERPVFMIQAPGTQVNPEWLTCLRQGITASQP